MRLYRTLNSNSRDPHTRLLQSRVDLAIVTLVPTQIRIVGIDGLRKRDAFGHPRRRVAI